MGNHLHIQPVAGIEPLTHWCKTRCTIHHPGITRLESFTLILQLYINPTGEASTSQDLPPTANSTPGRGRRRGKTAAISYMTKEPRRPIKVEPHVSTLDIDDVDKFLQEVNDGVLPEGLTDIWDDPPDFTFEDDFVVPENSDLNKVGYYLPFIGTV